MVTSGLVRRGSRVRIFRDGARIHETTVAQLKRFKDDAREVAEGFECGILLEGFNDLREGDIFEVYETREIERTSLDEPAERRVSRRSRSARVRRDPLGRAALSRGRIAEGKAQARPLREGAACRTASALRSPRSTTTISGSAAR